MTQEEKQLLLKDLCARLPYGIFVYDEIDNKSIYTISYNPHIDNCKPYLRPMSSMTEEEKEEYEVLQAYPGFKTNHTDLTDMYDWLNEKMFDYRGLISMSLALEAPEEMYKTDQI